MEYVPNDDYYDLPPDEKARVDEAVNKIQRLAQRKADEARVKGYIDGVVMATQASGRMLAEMTALADAELEGEVKVAVIEMLDKLRSTMHQVSIEVQEMADEQAR